MTHQITIKGEALPLSMFGTPYFWFDSLTGTEQINELFEYQLIVKIRDEYGNPTHGYAGRLCCTNLRIKSYSAI